jgi:hypothetical protein
LTIAWSCISHERLGLLERDWNLHCKRVNGIITGSNQAPIIYNFDLLYLLGENGFKFLSGISSYVTMDSIALLLDEDIVHFMAWLDFCCEKKMDFLTTIIDYLHDSREKQRKIPYSITVEEVVGGLIILAKRSKKPPSPGVCLSNGSSHFTCLSEKCKANIKSEVDKLLSLSLRQSKSQDKRLGKVSFVIFYHPSQRLRNVEPAPAITPNNGDE